MVVNKQYTVLGSCESILIGVFVYVTQVENQPHQ